MENLNKIFLDCGTNLGQGLVEFIDTKIIDKSFKIHSFEPNPYAYNFVKNRFNSNDYFGWNITLHNKAVWTDNCKKQFILETIETEFESIYTGKVSGENLKFGGASNIMIENWIKPSYIKDDNLSSDIFVDCIDFSTFLNVNFTPKDYIICKMDIEGAEYDVLTKLLSDNTITLIKEIYIEWHDRLIKNIFPKQQLLIEQLKKYNIIVHNWR